MAENGFRAFQRAEMSPQDMQLNTISCIFLQNQIKCCKTCLQRPATSRPIIAKYRSKVLQNSAILSIFIKLPFIMSFFEWPYKTGFVVTENPILAASSVQNAYLRIRRYNPGSYLILGFSWNHPGSIIGFL